jgi:uncharacterized protein YbaP (TraB family)
MERIEESGPLRSFRASFATLLVFVLCFAQGQAASAPAMWLVQGPKAKVYIFGTIHIMKPGVVWSTPAIARALSQSDDLWLEIPDDLRDPSALLPEVSKLGMDPEHPLSTKISKDDLSRLDAAFKAAGLPGEAPFESFRPWFAALMVSVLPAAKAGYSGANGIDANLRAQMISAGKPVKGFESLSEQLHLFADLSPSQEVALLHQSLATSETAGSSGGASDIDKLEAAWQSGDIAQVARYEAQMGALDPSLTAVLLIDRNANWAKQLDRRLQGAGTSFVAVGVAHLSGSGSLLEDLAKLGYTVTRLE